MGLSVQTWTYYSSSRSKTQEESWQTVYRWGVCEILHIQPRVRSEILSKDENETMRSVTQDSPRPSMLSCAYVRICVSMHVSQIRDDLYFPSFSHSHQCSNAPSCRPEGVCVGARVSHTVCVWVKWAGLSLLHKGVTVATLASHITFTHHIQSFIPA